MGMGAAFAGVIRVPISSVIMIFEITHAYAIIVRLMILNLVSFFISSRLQPVPIYEALARQNGIQLPSAATRERRGRPRVGQVTRLPGGTLSAETTVDAALTQIRQSGLNSALVTDQRGLAGVILAKRLEQVISDDHGAKALTEVLDPRSIVYLHPDHSLDLALERLTAAGVDLPPVVSRADVRQLEGIVLLRDVLETDGIAPRPAISASETRAGAKESDSPS